MRKSVSYRDGLKFNEDVARTLLSPALAMSRTDLVEKLDGGLPYDGGIVARNFRGLFYTDDENRWLDGFMALIDERAQPTEAVSLLRYLITSLKKRPFNLFHRANLQLRTNSSMRAFIRQLDNLARGFATHILQAFDELRRVGSFAPLNHFTCRKRGKVAEGYDLVYVDPPYVGLSDSHNREYGDGTISLRDFADAIGDMIDSLSPVVYL